MLPTHKKLPLILFCAVSLLTRQPVAATLLDWDTLGWTPGSLSNSYDIDPNETGNDLTFTLSDNVNTFTNDATSGVQTPAITMSLAGGVSPVQNSLQLSANLRSSTTITFTANFSAQYYRVSRVSLFRFSISTWNQTEIRSAIYSGSQRMGATLLPRLRWGRR